MASPGLTNVQSNVEKGRIVVLSYLAAARAFVRRVRLACTFAWDRYVTMGRHISPKSAPSRMGSGPHLIHGSLDQRWVSPPHGISIGSAVFARMPNTQTDTYTQTTLRATFVSIVRIYAPCAGDAAYKRRMDHRWESSSRRPPVWWSMVRGETSPPHLAEPGVGCASIFRKKWTLFVCFGAFWMLLTVFLSFCFIRRNKFSDKSGVKVSAAVDAEKSPLFVDNLKAIRQKEELRIYATDA